MIKPPFYSLTFVEECHRIFTDRNVSLNIFVTVIVRHLI